MLLQGPQGMKGLCRQHKPAAPNTPFTHAGKHRKHNPCQRQVNVHSKLSEVPLFSDNSLLGGPVATETVKDTKAALMEVSLNSKTDVDYTALRDYLAAGEWRQAEDETRALLIKLAGEGARKRNWVYFTEVKDISVEDMQILDNLWKAASGGRFGYSVQREIWLKNSKRWGKFFKEIDWTTGENNNYRKWPAEFFYKADAPKGHLPLTNALRGTQLFEAILEHPAFAKKEVKETIEQRAAQQAQNTLKWPSF